MFQELETKLKEAQDRNDQQAIVQLQQDLHNARSQYEAEQDQLKKAGEFKQAQQVLGRQMGGQQEQVVQKRIPKFIRPVGLKELNGDLFRGSYEGEELVATTVNTYFAFSDVPMARNHFEAVSLTADQAGEFIILNASAIKNAADHISEADCMKLAYARLCLLKLGLVSKHFKPQEHYVNYTEVIADDDARCNDLLGDDLMINVDEVNNVLTDKVKQDISLSITDRVCCVAHLFRVRGHHYQDSYEEAYRNLWEKMRFQGVDLQISHRHFSTIVSHAIYPIVLDEFFLLSANQQRVNGALAKRIQSVPAGVAAIGVIYQGLMDLQMVVPGIKVRLARECDYLLEQYDTLSRSRYDGSVNAKYYGAKRSTFDEKRVSSLAATIRAALIAFSDDCPLLKSPALKRVAAQAPITGAILARAIGKIANREEILLSLLDSKPPQ